MVCCEHSKIWPVFPGEQSLTRTVSLDKMNNTGVPYIVVVCVDDVDDYDDGRGNGSQCHGSSISVSLIKISSWFARGWRFRTAPTKKRCSTDVAHLSSIGF